MILIANLSSVFLTSNSKRTQSTVAFFAKEPQKLRQHFAPLFGFISSVDGRIRKSQFSFMGYTDAPL
jgi:hypothetical protein